MPAQFRHFAINADDVNTFEPSFGVEDLGATIAAVLAEGGKIVMPRTRIEGVGDLIYFRDTEGNLVGAMQYDEGIWK